MGMQAFAVAEGDLPTLADVHADAFDGSTLNRLMSPKGYTPRAREVMIGTLQQQMKDPSTHLIKAVDNETGEIAGFARWNIYPSGRSDEELNEPKPPRPEDPDINVELRNIAVDILEKTRRETMGKRPHCCTSSPTLILPYFPLSAAILVIARGVIQTGMKRKRKRPNRILTC